MTLSFGSLLLLAASEAEAGVEARLFLVCGSFALPCSGAVVFGRTEIYCPGLPVITVEDEAIQTSTKGVNKSRPGRRECFCEVMKDDWKQSMPSRPLASCFFCC